MKKCITHIVMEILEELGYTTYSGKEWYNMVEWGSQHNDQEDKNDILY